MMYRVLSKVVPSKDPISVGLHFAKLRFTRLTMFSSIAFLFAIFFLFVWVINSLFSGILSWYVFVIVPIFWNLSPSILVSILFLGMTSWKNFKSTYFCCCIKKD